MGADEEDLDKIYQYYRDYVDAETEYLRQPTAENWCEKEEAFERFNHILQDKLEDNSGRYR